MGGAGNIHLSEQKRGCNDIPPGPRVGEMGAATIRYFHDGLNVAAEYDGSDQLLRTHVSSGLDRNLCLTASGSRDYYQAGALGGFKPWSLSMR